MEKATEKITLDARGEKMTVYRTLIEGCSSSVLKNLTGCGPFSTTPQPDGSYFVDCDKKVLQFLLAFMETGHLPTTKYNPKYFKAVCDRFGIELKITKKRVPNIDEARETKYKLEKERMVADIKKSSAKRPVSIL